MSHLWYFMSFNKERLDAVFGAKSKAARDMLVTAIAAAQGEESAEDPETRALCSRLVDHGLSYDGLDDQQALAIDGIVALLFTPEGLEEFLELEFESPDGVHRSTVNALLSRLPAGQASPQVSLLLNGRRHGTDQHTGDNLFLSPQEQKNLLAEIETAYAAPGDWPHPDHKTVTREYLIDVLRNVIQKNKYCFARQG